MTEDLPADIRALLVESRAQLGPDPAAIARLRMRVAAGVGKGVASAALVKVALLGVAIASIGAIAYAVRRAPASEPAIAVAGAATADTDVAVHVDSVEREPAPPIAITAPSEPRHVEPVPAIADAPPVRSGVSLAREIELVDRASQALHRGELARVTLIIRTYDVETAGSGQLAEDAAAIAVEAACTGQGPTAAAQLASFQQRWPNSAQRARLDAACHPGAKP